ncbi:hypothetical protein [Geminicoccus harenae]|uniref:hypothetical protein n=1 Tax=Geminicoccus harenae TaxID=2498453 RepID=UPI00168B8ECF|nr:hypothetical protein [Geminicoccus harenae]
MHNPADGRMYDSKRAFQRAVRAAGCEIIGNERPAPRRHESAPGLGQTIAEVVRGERR